MNHALIFERVYMTPLMLSAEGMRSVDAVLRPRLLGKAPVPPEENYKLANESANSRKKRPRATMSPDGKQVADPRLYGMVGPGVAQVPVKGVLARNVSAFEAACFGLTGYETIAAALQQASAAQEVQEIILDVDSPGGECIGCFELADLIAGIDKPVYGFTEGLAASAAYALISQTTEIYATRSAMLGSIGVICSVLDDSANLAQDGFKMEYFTAGANKLAFGGSGYTLNDADRQITQDRVNYYYSLFTQTVLDGREAAIDNVEPIAQGSAKIYVGEQAVDAGLCDAIVTGFDEVVQLILEARSAA